MPTPRELSQQIPTPQAKSRMQKPQGGDKVLVQIPGVRGGMVMDEIDTCITSLMPYCSIAEIHIFHCLQGDDVIRDTSSLQLPV